MFKKYLQLLSLFALCAALKAQQGSETQYHVQFKAISWDQPLNNLKFVSSNTVVTMDLNSFTRSTNYDYVGPNPLVFGVNTKTAKDGKVSVDPLVSVPLTQFKPQTLLLFKSTEQGGYSVSVIDDGNSSIPPGGFRFISLCNDPLDIVCGKDRLHLVPHQSATIVGNPNAAETIFATVFANSVNGQRKVYENAWPYSKQTRCLIFVFQDPTTKQYLLKKIIEEAHLP
jgi:hypothetical protein